MEYLILSREEKDFEAIEDAVAKYVESHDVEVDYVDTEEGQDLFFGSAGEVA